MAHSDQVAGQGAGITVHAVVLVSAAVFAAALKLALQAHAGVAPLNAALGAGAIFLGLVVLHLVVRPRASRLVAPVKVRVKRSKLKVADKATVGTIQELAASPRGALASQRDASETPSSASATPSRAPAMPSSYVPPPAMEPALVAPLHQSAMRERPALRGFEHLQTLVAELARQTPGPKAATPDPDAVQAATAVAWAEYVATRATQAAVADPASTLKSAAQAMAFAAPAPKISTPGLVAELSDALAADRLTIYLEPIQQIELQRPRHY